MLKFLSQERSLQIAVEVGQVPRYLYKYRILEAALTILKDHSVYFATSNQFNDPFDCAMQISDRFTKEDWQRYLNSQGVESQLRDSIVEKIMANPGSAHEVLKESIEEIKNQVGLLCLSDRYDNLSLWAHYADNHRGVCLEFDILADPETFSIPKRVSYDDAFPMIDYLKDPVGVVNALFHKSKDWQVEGEYRIIKHRQVGIKEFRPEALSKVVLGLRCDDKDVDKIKYLLNPKVYTKVQLFKTVQMDSEYKVELRPVSL